MLLHQIIAVKLKGQFTQKFKFALSFLNFRPYKMEVTLFLEWNSKVDFWLKPWFLVIHKMQASGCMINTCGSWRYIQVLWSKTIGLCKKLNIIYNTNICNTEPQTNG